MSNRTKIIFASSIIALSNLAFAQADASGTSTTSNPTQSSSDPFVQNREEKAKARAEYKKEKKASRRQYKEVKKESNQKLKLTGQRSESEKNMEAPK